MLTLDDVLSLAPDIVARESDGEQVVVLPEQGKFIVLNQTGADVFRAIDGRLSLGAIAAALSERHDAPLDEVESDVLAFAGELLKRGAARRLEPDVG
jgi:hypothetical protein